MSQEKALFRIKETGDTVWVDDLITSTAVSVDSESLHEAGLGDEVTAYYCPNGYEDTWHLVHWGYAEMPEDHVIAAQPAFSQQSHDGPRVDRRASNW